MGQSDGRQRRKITPRRGSLLRIKKKITPVPSLCQNLKQRMQPIIHIRNPPIRDKYFMGDDARRANLFIWSMQMRLGVRLAPCVCKLIKSCFFKTTPR